MYDVYALCKREKKAVKAATGFRAFREATSVCNLGQSEWRAKNHHGMRARVCANMYHMHEASLKKYHNVAF